MSGAKAQLDEVTPPPMALSPEMQREVDGWDTSTENRAEPDVPVIGLTTEDIQVSQQVVETPSTPSGEHELDASGVSTSSDEGSKCDPRLAELERLKMQAVAAEDFERARSLKTQIAAIESPPEEANTATLLANALQFFNDNYLMVMMAASASQRDREVYRL